MADRRVGEHVGAVAHGRDAEALRLGELRAQRCRKAPAEAAGMRFLEPRAVVLAPQDAELRAELREDAGRQPRQRLAEAQADQRLGDAACAVRRGLLARSEGHTSELPSLLRTPYAVFCLNKKKRH